jgi:uncharacterized protein involved in response to NO
MTGPSGMAEVLKVGAMNPASQVSREASPEEIMRMAKMREASLSRLLVAYVSSGLVFMLLPGTFLGVWNLLQITGRESIASISPAWLQAHGHAQVFGWVGSFILGIGFYSIPKWRGSSTAIFRVAWVCWAMWTAGVALRWLANVYGWGWRLLLPASAALELTAFLMFLAVVSRHRPEMPGKSRMEPWIWVVMGASAGLSLLLLTNLAGCIYVSRHGADPAFPHLFDQRYLALMTWGFLVPFVWGFSAKWMPIFLGLKPVRAKPLIVALALNFVGIALTALGLGDEATALFVISTALAIVALRMFEPAIQPAKTRGVHQSFPLFIRLAYGWLLLASLIGVAAALWDSSGGIWGASRHALTVGFIATMVLSIGQRILPAFAGMRLLWSTQLMFAGLLVLMLGCALRVSGEILAYQGYAEWAWQILPPSAMLELAGIGAFAANIFGTFLFEPSHAQKEAITLPIPPGAA